MWQRPLGGVFLLCLSVSALATSGGGAGGHFPSAEWRAGTAAKVASAVAGVVDAHQLRAVSSLQSLLVRLDPAGRVQVRVGLNRLDAAARLALESAGMEIEIVNQDLHMARGWIPAAAVRELASLGIVEHIDSPDYAFTRAGAATGEHAAILGCDEVRARFGLTGAGVRVGVISDGIDHIGSSQATGDAPPVEVPADRRCRRGEGDEGSAMIELIHDCAPGATVGFCGPLDDLEMIECVECLHEVFGADIMVDDLGFASQPFFADGPVAQAVARAVGDGVAYFSAAGNEAQLHYQGRYRRCGLGVRHEFAPSDCTMDFFFSGALAVVLQWDEPFGQARSDYDLCVPGLGCSENVQNGNDDPLEAVAIECGSASCPAGLEIYKRSGADVELEVFFRPLGRTGLDLFEHRTLTDSIFGHPCVEGVIAVGAIDAAAPNHDAIEEYSSRGPCTIALPSRVVRSKPDLAGVDGLAHTGPGGFPTPFFGTSAAAPGVAGAAALLMQLSPALTSTELRQVFAGTAVDLGSPGHDLSFGFGRVDALAAALSLAPDLPTPTPTVPPAATPTPGPCFGDCNADGRVVVNELITGVGISLGSTSLATCPTVDTDGNGSVNVNELIQGVNAALNGCVPM